MGGDFSVGGVAGGCVEALGVENGWCVVVAADDQGNGGWRAAEVGSIRPEPHHDMLDFVRGSDVEEVARLELGDEICQAVGGIEWGLAHVR